MPGGNSDSCQGEIRWLAVAVMIHSRPFAAVAGTAFTTTGDAADSMAMSIWTGVALLCYAVNLCLLGQVSTVTAG
jgi:hypothetical protein